MPDAGQTLLLHAVIDAPEQARVAALRWLGAVDFDRLDEGSQRLLPLLHARLGQLGVEHPLAGRIKGFHRRSWFRDQMLRHRLAGVRAMFREAGVDCILLKGVGLAADVYDHGALRPMQDVDLLVRREDFARSSALLEQAGWRHDGIRPLSPFEHALTFYGDAFAIDLHVTPFHETVRSDALALLWADRRRALVHGETAELLSPGDQLLHTLAYGQETGAASLIRWVADAVFIIRRHDRDLDWDRFVSRAEQLELTLVAWRGLRYLAREYDAPVPGDVLSRLESCKRRLFEKLEYRFYRDGSRTPFSKLAAIQRTLRPAGLIECVTMMFAWYRVVWGCERPLEMFCRIVIRILLGRRLTAHIYGQRSK
jgi:hypothetical protein